MSEQAQILAVIGGGTMGADIAASFAAHGWTAHVVEPQQGTRETLARRTAAAMQALGGAYEPAQFPVHSDLATVPWAEVALVIEAVPESSN